MEGKKRQGSAAWSGGRFLWIAALAFWGMYAFANLRDLQGVIQTQSNYLERRFSVETAFFGVMLAYSLWYIQKRASRRHLFFSVLAGILGSLLYISAYTIQYQNNIADTLGQWLLFLLYALGLSPLGIAFFVWLFRQWEQKSLFFFRNASVQESCAESPSFVRICLSWFVSYTVGFLPAYLAFYPGIFAYDARYEYDGAVRQIISPWHTLAHSRLFFLVLSLGEKIGYNHAWALFSAVQLMLVAFSFAYGIAFLGERGMSRRGRILFGLASLWFPLHAVMSVSWTKDVPFAAFFLLYLIAMVRFFGGAKKDGICAFSMVQFVLFATGMLLFRNNAIHACLLSVPCLVLILRRKKKQVLLLSALLVVAVAMRSGINRILADGSEIRYSKAETYSVLFQQLARVYCYAPDGVEDIEAGNVYAYISPEGLAAYSAYISDPVKSGVHNDALEEDLGSFLKEWLRVGVRHPGDYLEAFLTVNMGSWYVDDTAHAMIYGSAVLLGGHEAYMELLERRCFFPGAKVWYSFWFAGNHYQTIPFVSLLFRPGTYFGLCYVAFWLLLDQKRYSLLLPLIPMLAYLITILFAPVALIRYVYCLMISAPFVLAQIVTEERGTLK